MDNNIVRKLIELYFKDGVFRLMFEDRYNKIFYKKERKINYGKIWYSKKNIFDLYNKIDDEGDFSIDRKFVLYNLVLYSNILDGDIVECGVYKGGSVNFILSAINKNKKLYLFDSFKGFDAPSLENDPYHWKKGDLSAQVEILFKNLHLDNNCIIFEGYIPYILKSFTKKTISLLHIDVDLYQPTLDSLEYFYSMLVVGGIILCDDYGFYGTYGARKAMDEFSNKNNLVVIELPTGQGIIIKN